ncbi:MAG: hypothetical protein ABIO70_03805 [Pseudomonadota bacterium]
MRVLALSALLILPGCAATRHSMEARRTWSDVALDDPVEPERVLAFLAAYDPGPEATPPRCVETALWVLDTWRRESRHWIAEVTEANARFQPGDLPQATVDQLAGQLTGLVLLLGPPRAPFPGWPAEADPYPWTTGDSEMRVVYFDLYVQAGRFCPAAASVPAGCLVTHDGAQVPLAWVLAADLAVFDPDLLARVADPAERAAIATLAP